MSFKRRRKYLTRTVLNICLWLFFLFVSNFSYSQLDYLHYLPPLKQTSGTNNNANHQSSAAIQQQAIYLSTPETTAFSVDVYRGNSATPWLTIPSLVNGTPFIIDNVDDSAGAFVDVVLANSNNNITLVTNGNTGQILDTAGLRFESSDPTKKFYVNYRGRSSAQAGSLTCKGTKALGKEFRWGGIPNEHNNANSSTSLGMMATVDGTIITISGYDEDCAFRDGTDPNGITDNVFTRTLNSGQTFVLEMVRNQTGITTEENAAHIDGWIGATITATEPIAIANGGLNTGVNSTSQGRDVGIDQPVPINVLGREYVFIRGNGANQTEFPIIVATSDDTEVYAGTTLIDTIDDGEYLEIPGSYYSGTSAGANMYVRTTKEVYAYQCLGGQAAIQTIGMNFIAPVNCLLPSTLNEIPQIQRIALTDSNSSALTIIAATLIPDGDVDIYQDGVLITTPASSTITGTTEWKTFFVDNLSGEISVDTPGPIAVGTFMSLGANAGLAGYFSGFDTTPVVEIELTGGGCHPGSNLQEVTGGFANYEWYKGFDEISGTLLASGPTLQTYDPTLNGIGNYFVRVTDFGGCEYNSAVVTFFSCDPELQVIKIDDADPIDAGSNVTFTITAESFSVDPITNVTIEDIFPAELEFVSANPESGTTFSTTGAPTWNIGGMNPGDKFELEIVARARDDASGTVTNTITYNYDEIASEINSLTDDLDEPVTINPCNTATAPSSTPTLCMNTGLIDITHTTTLATGIGVPTGLPSGITASWASNTITISGIPTVSGVFNYDIPLTGGCNTVSATGTITVNALPIALDITGVTEVCEASTINLTEGTSGTIAWTSSDVSVATINASGVVTGVDAGSTNITYTVTDANGCVSNSSSAHVVTVNPIPVFNSLNTNSPICEGDDAEFYISGSSSVVLTYNIDGNINQTVTLDGSGDATITNSGATSNTTINLISLEYIATGCSISLTNSETVTVNPSPTLTTAVDIIECIESPIQTLNANDGITFDANVSIEWYDAATGGNVITTPTLTYSDIASHTNDPVSYFAELTNTTTSCVNPVRVEIVLQIVSPPFPNFMEEVCSNEALNIAVGSFATTYTVVSSDETNVPAGPARTSALAANITETYINTTGTDVIITYTVTVDDGSACDGEIFDVVVTVNPEPFNAIPPAETICSGEQLNHDLTSDVNVSGTTFSWTAANNTNITGETISGGVTSSITDTLINTSVTSQIVVYTITPTNPDSCEGSPFTYTVTVKPEISFTTQPIISQTLCIGAILTDLSVTLTGGIDGLSYQWQRSNTSGSGFTNIALATSLTYTPVTTSSVTTYYRVIVSDDSGICADLISKESEVIINADPTITSQPTTTQTLCIGATPTDLSVVANGGVNGLTYQWESSATSGSGFTAIGGAINATYTPPTTTVGTIYYQVVISDTGSGCTSVTSTESEVIINADPTITSQPETTQTLCEDATPTDLVVVVNGGVDGLTYQWETSATSGSGFTAIGGATSATYTPPTTTVGTIYYQVIISDTGSGCTSVTSTESEVIINADPTITSQPTATQTLCEGATPTDLVVLTNGGVDGLTYQWESSATSGSGFTAISGATNATYTPPTTTVGTIYYQAVISDTGSGCTSVISTESEVIINADPTITSQPTTTQTLCEGATPTDLSVVANGGVDGLTYQWESSTTSGSGFTAIGGATNSTYTPPTTTAGTIYYQVVISDTGSGCTSLISTESEVIINADPTITSQPTTTQTLCEGATPTDLVVVANGGVDGLTYQWESSATSGSGFTAISGATNSTYTPLTTTVGTIYYEVVISDTGSGCTSITSAESEVIINADPTITSQPTTTQTLCEGATPTDLVVIVNGGVDGLTYQWESSATSGSGFTAISGATNATYTPPTTAVGTIYYQAVISDTGSGCTSVISTESEIIINADPTITSQPTTTQTLCEGATPTDLVIVANGGVDGLTYQWEFSATSGSGFTVIGGATNATYTPVTTTVGTIYYQVVISDTGSGCMGVTSTESEVIINADPTITSQPTTTQTLCEGATPTDLVVVANGGVDGLTYQWESSATSGSGFTAISGATNATYTPPTTTVGTIYYQVIISDTGSGCTSVTSTESEVVINPLPVFTSLTSNTPICEGEDAQFFVVGSPSAVLTYNVDGNADQTITLNGAGEATITNAGSTSDVTINLVSLAYTATSCSIALTNSTIVTVNSNPVLTTATDIIECVESPVQTLDANNGITYGANVSVVWYDALTGGNIVINPTSNAENAPISYYAELTDTTSSCVNPVREEVVLHIVSPPFPNFTEEVCSNEALNIDIDSFTATYTVVSSDPTNVPAAANRTTAIAQNITDTYENTSGAPVVVTYTVTIDDGTACDGETFDVIVTVNPQPDNVSPPVETICSGETLAHDLITDVNVAGSTFNWVAIDNTNVSGETISGGITASISDTLVNTSGSVQTVVYQITPTSSNGCDGETYNYTVTVKPEISFTTQPEVTQTLCVGATPTDLEVVVAGAVDGVSYQWESSTSSGGGFTAISGERAISFTPPTTTVGTMYYRVVISDISGICSDVISEEAIVIINADPTITTQPLTTQTICEGAAPTDLEVIANGGVDGLMYQWESSASSGTGFTTIAGATNANYTPITTVIGTTYYRIIISDAGSGCTSITSDESEVIINADPAITSQPLTTQTICEGATPTDLEVIANGGVDGLTYQWESSTTIGTGFMIISGAINATYTPQTTTVGTTYYRVVINDSGSGCNSITSDESEVIINADPAITSQPITTQTICEGAIPNDLEVIVNGGVAGLTYQWESSITSGTGFTVISGATNATYTPITVATGTIYYRVVISDAGSGCTSATSLESEVIINADPTITSQPIITQTICEGATPTDLEVVANGGVAGLTYQWESSPTSGTGFTQILGATNATYTPLTSSVGTIYYRVVINDAGSGCTTVISDESEVIINADPTITSQPIVTQELCEGATPTDLEIVANGGVSGLTYQWESSSTSGTGFTSISGATNATYIPNTVATGTMYYRVVINDAGSGCTTIISDESEVIINADPTITSQPISTQTLCELAIPTNLTVIANGGVDGLTYQWESSTTSGIGFTAISGATNASYTPPTATAGTTYYRVVISDLGSGCTSITSAESELIINPLPIFTSLTTNTPICEGEDAEFYLLGSPSAIITYNIDGNANQTVTLDGAGEATIVNTASTVDVTINLISLEYSTTNCIINLTNSATVIVNPNPSATTVSDINQCVETPIQTLNANDGIVLSTNVTVVWYDALVGGNIVGSPTLNTVNSPISYYAELTDTNSSCVNPVREEVSLHILSPPFPNFVEEVCSNEALNVAINSFTATYMVISSDPTNVPAAANRTTAIAQNITDSYENTTGNDVTITYTVTIDDGTACDGETFDVVVTVNPQPFNASVPTDIVCSDVALNHDLNTDVNVTGGTFTWEAADNVNVTGETVSGGTASTITDVLTNITGSVQTVIYTVTPTSANGCEGDAFTYEVTVNPEPFNTTAPTDIVCSDVALNHDLNLDVNVAGASFSWIATDNANVTGETLTSSSSTSITDTLTNISGSAQIVEYTIIATSSNGCIGDAFTYEVTVNPEPNTITEPTDMICSDATLNHDLNTDVNIAGSTFSWIATDNTNVTGETLATSSSTSITDTLTNISGSDQTVEYTITATSPDGCIGDSYTYAVTVNPEPFNVTAPTEVVCSDIALNHDLNTDVNVTGSTFSWIATDNANITGETLTTNSSAIITDTLTNISGSVQRVEYTITATSPNGCIGDSYTYTVTVNPEPNNAIAPTDIVCSDIALNHDLNSNVNVTGSTFSWIAADNTNITGETLTTSSSTSITDTLTNISGSVQTVVYTITATSSDGCIGDPYTYTVTVNPEPNNVTAPTEVVCSDVALNHNLLVDVNTPSGATFSWIAADNTNITGETLTTSSSTSITDTLTNISGSVQTVIYTIIPTSVDGCLGDPYTYTVTVNPEPNTIIAPTDLVCSDIALNHDLNTDVNVTGATFNWFAADNTNVNGETTITSATTSITDTLTNISGSVQTVEYTIIPTSSDGCIGDPYMYTVTVNPEPNNITAPTDLVCSDVVLNHDLNTDVNLPGTTFSWLATDNPAITGETTVANTSTSITDTLTNISGSVQTIVYTITPTSSDGCIGDAYTYTVTVNPEPFNVTAPTTDVVCSDIALNHDLTSDIDLAGTTFTWVATSNINVSGETLSTSSATIITDTLTNLSGSVQTVVYTITPTSADGCLGDPFVYTVTVNPEPYNSVAPTNTICSDIALNHDLNTDVNVAGSTFSWIALDNPAITGETLSTSSATSITDTLTNISGVAQTVEYIITATSPDGCIGDPYTYTVIVNPEPNIITAPTDTTCSNVAINHDLTADVDLTGTTFTWVATDNTNVSGETTTVSTNTNITDTLINVSGAVQIVVYTITPSSADGCVGDPYTYTVTVSPAGAFVVEKSSLPAADGSYNSVGEVIQYEITVENSNDVEMTNVSITDMNADIGSISPTNVTSIPAFGSVTFTAAHTITQNDLDAGEVINSAMASGTDPCGNVVTATSDDPDTTDPNDDTIVSLEQTPAISLLKTATFNDEDGDGFPQEGETITYNFTIENTGNTTITGIEVSDPLITVNGGPIDLAPSNTDSTTFFGTFTISQANIDAGSLTNSATVSGDDPNGDPVIDTSDDPNDTTDNDSNGDGDPDDVTLFEFDEAPELTIFKTGVFIDANNDGFAQVGETIAYTFDITNTGNVTISGITISDALVSVSGSAITLAPNETDATTFTATYTLTQDDVDAGNVTNTATASGTTPSGATVTDDSDDPTTTDNNDATVTTLSQDPQLTLLKTSVFNDEDGDGFPQEGETITYIFDVRNTGNVVITNISITDALVTVNGGPIDLVPNQTDATTFTATYVLTQNDINTGSVTNTATVTGEDPNGDPVTDISDDPTNSDDNDANGDGNPDDSTVTTLGSNPQMSVEKVGVFADENGDGITQVGETISYTFNVINTGNVTISNIIITDALVTVSGSAISLDPTENDNTTFTATYTLTQDDIDSGSITNTATVNGEDPSGDSVTDTSDDPNNPDDNDPNGDGEPDDNTITEFPLFGEISLTKATLPASDGSYDTLGEQIMYELIITNTGNVTLTDVEVTDANADSGSITPASIASISPGVSVTVNATHTITQDDLNAGFVTNTASVAGEDPFGNMVTDDSDDPNNPADNDTNGDGDPDDITNTTIDQKPSMELEKVAVFNDENGDGIPQLGETLTYNFSVENTGNVTLTNISITDPLVTVNGGPITLAPTEVNNSTFYAEYTITQLDIDNGSVTNSASVNGEDPIGGNVTDTSDDPNDTTNNDINGDGDPDDSTVTTLPSNPELILSKTGTFIDANNDGLAQAGETIQYVFDIFNSGNVTISGIIITDPIVTVSGSPITLIPGQRDSSTFTATYTLTQTDVDNGVVENTASVSGNDPSGNTITDDSDDPTTTADNDATITTLARDPQLSLFKIGIFNDENGDGIPQEGETISYVFDVRNTGNVTIFDVIITDPIVTVSGAAIDLIPGQIDNTTFTAEYTIQQTDIDAGSLSNTALAVGEDNNGGTITDVSDYSDDPDNPINEDLDGDGDPDDPTVTTLTGNPELNLDKIGTFNDEDGNGVANVGETITYVFEVENIGNVTITNITVSDPLVTVNGSSIDLIPGQIDTTTFTATHTITQFDIDAGGITNAAVVSGQDPNGDVISDNSDDPNNASNVDDNNDGNPDDDTVTTIPVQGSISILKEAIVATDGNYDTLGEVITYTIVVTNTGNITLSNIEITDANADVGSISPSNILLLAPNESITVVAQHTITQADLDAGEVNNTANVTAEDPFGNTVTDDSDDPNNTTDNDTNGDGDPDDVTNTLIDQNPSLSLLKTSDIAPDGLWDTVGEVITYSLTVTNTGNVTITNLVITDANADVGSISPANIASLAPGETVNIVASHTITQNDLDTGSVSNTATVTGEDPNGGIVIDDSDDPNNTTDNDTNGDGDPDDITITTTPQTGILDIVKEVDVLTYENIGDLLTYTITITNTGNVTLLNIIVTDPNATLTGVTTVASLAPNESFVTTAEHVVTAEDIDTGFVENTAFAAATIINSTTSIIEDSDDPTIDTNIDIDNDGDFEDPTVSIFDGISDISITKEVSNLNPVVGDEITFTITVTNEGSVSTSNISVEELLPSGYEFISYVTTVGDYSNTTGLWVIDTLEANDIETLEVTVRVIGFGDYLNTASITSIEGATDMNTSNDIDTATITPECLGVYNEFSPNGDGINEYLHINCIENYTENVLEIFNRWGNTVYKVEGYNNGTKSFVGESNGRATITTSKQLPVGTYFYVLDLGDGSDVIKGWIYINR